MNITQIFYLMSGITLALLTILLFVVRLRILSFLRPELYSYVTILESDNNTRSWIQRKNSDLRFKFNKGVYNMFESKIDNQQASVVYRHGRLAHFFYNEGNSDPIDFRNIKTSTNPQLVGQLQKTEAFYLFTKQRNDFMTILVTYIIPIMLIIGIIIIIYLLTKKSPEPITVPQVKM